MIITHTTTGCFSQANHLALEASVHPKRPLAKTPYRTLERSANSWQNYRELICKFGIRSNSTLLISRLLLLLIDHIKQDYVVAVAKSISGLVHDNYEYIINMKWLYRAVKKERKRYAKKALNAAPVIRLWRLTAHALVAFATILRRMQLACACCMCIRLYTY